MSKRLKFSLVLAAMLIFLAGMSTYHQLVLTSGRTVTVETEPVDPRSLFRGDYVGLGYRMNHVPCEVDPRSGQEVYVELVESGDVWEPRSLKTTPSSDPGAETTYVQGYYVENRSETCRVEYPSVQSYFVPEGKGEKIEKYRREGLKVKIALSRNGYPVIKELVFPDQ